jgi:hypothetical protein
MLFILHGKPPIAGKDGGVLCMQENLWKNNYQQHK